MNAIIRTAGWKHFWAANKSIGLVKSVFEVVHCYITKNYNLNIVACPIFTAMNWLCCSQAFQMWDFCSSCLGEDIFPPMRWGTIPVSLTCSERKHRVCKLFQHHFPLSIPFCTHMTYLIESQLLVGCQFSSMLASSY